MPLTTAQLEHARANLGDFQLRKLFLEDLGWFAYKNPSADLTLKDGTEFVLDPVAQVSGVVVLEVRAKDGVLPDKNQRQQIHNAIAKKHHENLLVFTDRNAKGDVSSSIWSWAKKEGTKRIPRELYYLRGQSGDLLLSKLHGMFIDMSELDDDGRIPVPEVTRRLAESFDIERVTKKFFGEFQSLHGDFVELIEGIDDPADRKWYASVLLNRLMFVYFMQKKGFVDANPDYLWQKFKESQKVDGKDKFYSVFLDLLFFEGFAKDETKRSATARKRLGKIKYLNGGLFLHHSIEKDPRYKGKIRIPDQAFANLLSADDPKGLFERFTWALDDRPGGDDRTINPDVLGYIFEKYINQKAFGAYYTRPEITDYLCERTINQLVLERLNVKLGRSFGSLNDALVSMDKKVVRALLLDGSEDGAKGILQDLSILDPACGSGAFILAAMKRLFEIHVALVEKIKYLHDPDLDALDRQLSGHASREYGIKKRLITDNLYGVDLMDEAVEICRLRLFLALVSSVHEVGHLQPLPNIDFNIFPGNSLIGVLRFPARDDSRSNLFGAAKLASLRNAAEQIAQAVDLVRHPASNLDPEVLRDDAQALRAKWNPELHDFLLSDFRDELGIQFEQEQAKGKPKARELTLDDLQRLKPFHWCLDFYKVMERAQGGFDIIITNPPWEVVQAEEKEFLATVVEGPMREDAKVKAALKKHGIDVIQKKTIDIKDWGKLRDDLLTIPEIERRWLAFCSEIPHQVAWYKNAPQYANQKSVVDGKNMTRKINLYGVFTEQCFNLLRKGGLCGIVIPSGIYTDLGTMQLREMLFSKTEVTGLFGFENRNAIFEGVHRSFKFVVLTFEKGGRTTEFPAVFMRTEVGELAGFPEATGFTLSTKLIRGLSPDTLAIPEFHSVVDVAIAEKAAKFPTLGATVPGKWQLQLKQELNMTQDSDIFQDRPAKGRLPLVEGKMFHQFTYPFAEGRYWIDERAARERILGRTEDTGQKLVYQTYRYVHRNVASGTNERSMITTVLPPNCFCPHTTITVKEALQERISLFLVGVLNSFVVDYLLRQRISMHLDAHFIYQLPVPRLTEGDKWFSGIVERAARLICTTPEYDDLAKEVGLGSHKRGATEFADRARLRAELDGIVAHLYGLAEDEFAHILKTFPLVKDEVKLAALNAYRDLERGLLR